MRKTIKGGPFFTLYLEHSKNQAGKTKKITYKIVPSYFIFSLLHNKKKKITFFFVHFPLKQII